MRACIEMNTNDSSVRVAVVQAAASLFNAEESLAKAVEWIESAAKQGAHLALLPEAFIPGYPRGLSFGCTVGNRTDSGRDLWSRYWESAIDIPGPELDVLRRAAEENSIHVAIGVVERGPQQARATLYCTLVYIGPDGALLGIHRKLKPTGSERIIWGEGDGSTLTVIDTPLGRIGGLICWENYMPLARMALYRKGVQIYLAPTADARPTWQSTLEHIACEGRCFVLGCNQFVAEGLPIEQIETGENIDHELMKCRGGSSIVSPFGEVLAGPLYDQEGLLVADLDMKDVVRGKLDFDVVGHYARPDVFQLEIDETRRVPDPLDSPDPNRTHNGEDQSVNEAVIHDEAT
ncbi:carbon-nitrogen hydrolase family protein [Candidatus Bipolaricaulota bacterium]